MYSPALQRSLKVAASVDAAQRKRVHMEDVSAGVPKSPYVRELFVDALTGNQIGELSILLIFSFLFL